jgi:ABC-type transporter Mla subunit MlaD
MSELGGIGGVNNLINEALKGVSDARKIAQEIIMKLDEYTRQVDEQIKKDLLKKTQEAVERLQKVAKSMGGTINSLNTIQDKISDLRMGGVSPSDNTQLKQIQKTIEDLKKQLQI